MMPPLAIQDEVQYAHTFKVIDRLMAIARATKGQTVYLETLGQLVQAYEAEHHAIDTTDIGALDSLKHLLNANHMSGPDFARILSVHPSLGPKILKGEHSLTVDHLSKVAVTIKSSHSPAAISILFRKYRLDSLNNGFKDWDCGKFPTRIGGWAAA